MKIHTLLKGSLVLAAIPAAIGGTVLFHPGIAYAQPVSQDLTPATKVLPGSFNVDPYHTSIGFDIGHMGLSRVAGRFTDVSGTINIDPSDATKNRVEVVIKTQSIDTHVEMRDNHLRTADFFDVAKYPDITFKSTGVKKKGTGYVVDGNLTIKDVTKPVSLDFKAFGPIPDMNPDGGSRVGFIAEPLTIDRQDYHISYDQKLPGGAPAVSNDVVIRISLEAVQPKK